MPDSRQTARDKERGRPLAQAPRPKERGERSPLGHVGQYEGKTVTFSDHATRGMPGGRRSVVLGSRNG